MNVEQIELLKKVVLQLKYQFPNCEQLVMSIDAFIVSLESTESAV